MNLIWVLLVVLLILALVPIYPAGWGFYPNGGIGLVVVILLILLLLGRI